MDASDSLRALVVKCVLLFLLLHVTLLALAGRVVRLDLLLWRRVVGRLKDRERKSALTCRGYTTNCIEVRWH